MPTTTPRFAVNHLVATVTANTFAVTPVPVPTRTPQSSTSCRDCCIKGVRSRPPLTDTIATRTVRRRPKVSIKAAAKGPITSLSRDAIIRRKRRQKRIAGSSQVPAPVSQRGELVYAARISLDRTEMQIDENPIKLSPGMAVTVEIKTGSRSVISYLLSPLFRYRHDSLTER